MNVNRVNLLLVTRLHTDKERFYLQVDGIDGYGNVSTPPGMSSGADSPGSSNGGGGRTRKQKEDKICGVCGDRALGYNFDAISCESCKAFFRRNAPKSLVSTCVVVGTSVNLYKLINLLNLQQYDSHLSFQN